MNKKWEVEDSYHPKVVEILEKNGFKNIIRMPRFSLYDYEAEKNDSTVYVEVRSRSVGMAPYFIIRKSKMQRLRDLKNQTSREVYFLLLQGDDYALYEIDEDPENVKPFKLKIYGKEVPGLRFYPLKRGVTEEDKTKIVELRKRGFTIAEIAMKMDIGEGTVRNYIPQELKQIKREQKLEKEDRLVIRCNSNTKKEWHEILYEYKKKGFTAQDVFKLMIEYLEQYHQKGKIY